MAFEAQLLRLYGSDHRPVVTHMALTKMLHVKRLRCDERFLDCNDLQGLCIRGWKKGFGDVPSIMERAKECRKQVSYCRRENNMNLEK